MTLTDVAKPEKWSEFSRTIAAGVIIAMLTSIGSGMFFVYQLGIEHQQTASHLSSIDEQITDARKGISDVRSEQENVKKNLSDEHDHVKDITAAVKAITDDIVNGRQQTWNKIESIDQQSRQNAEALAVNKQISSDIKETISNFGKSLDRHSDDLSAIRGAVDRIAPAPAKGH